MTHAWANDPTQSTATDVFWYCPRCQNWIGFNRPGVGLGPSATESALPPDVDRYCDPCVDDATALENESLAVLGKIADAGNLSTLDASDQAVLGQNKGKGKPKKP